MAQLHRDYESFAKLKTEVLVMVPNGPVMIKKYIEKCAPPYPILTDKGSKVAAQYFQIQRFFSLGTPMVFVVDHQRKIRYAFYSKSFLQEPNVQEPLTILQSLSIQESA